MDPAVAKTIKIRLHQRTYCTLILTLGQPEMPIMMSSGMFFD